MTNFLYRLMGIKQVQPTAEMCKVSMQMNSNGTATLYVHNENHSIQIKLHPDQLIVMQEFLNDNDHLFG